MVFYDNRRKNLCLPPTPPPPPVDELFDELSGENFLGYLKKYRAKECCRKKNSCKQLGDEKKFVHRKIAQLPPQISNGRSLTANGRAVHAMHTSQRHQFNFQITHGSLAINFG